MLPTLKLKVMELLSELSDVAELLLRQEKRARAAIRISDAIITRAKIRLREL